MAIRLAGEMGLAIIDSQGDTRRKLVAHNLLRKLGGGGGGEQRTDTPVRIAA